MTPGGRGLRATSLDATDARLVARMRQDFPLDERPFARLGEALGLAEEEVIERLRRLLASGALAHLGPQFLAGPEAAVRIEQLDPVDAQLVACTRSGLPLVPEPYEAVGALLALSAAEVRERLAAMLASGLVLRIGVVARP